MLTTHLNEWSCICTPPYAFVTCTGGQLYVFFLVVVTMIAMSVARSTLFFRTFGRRGDISVRDFFLDLRKTEA